MQLTRKRLRFAVLRCAESRAAQHRIPAEWPEAAPTSLSDAFEEHIGQWLRDFGRALPTPTPESIKGRTKTKPGNIATFLPWTFALQQQQRAATKRTIMSETGASEAEPAGVLKGLARGHLWSTHAHAICISPSSLSELLKEVALQANEGASTRKWKRSAAAAEYPASVAIPTLWDVFPGAKRLLKGRLRRLHLFIRTDEVTASVTCLRTGPGNNEPEFKTPRVDYDCQEPRDGQRLVAIDRGRRDMITLVSSDPP